MTDKMPVNAIYCTEKDVMKMTALSRGGIRSQMENNAFPKPVKFGKAIRWKIESVMQWLDLQEKKANV